MLRKTLLATTALVVCAPLARAASDRITPKDNPALAKMLSHAAQMAKGVTAIVHMNARGGRPVHNIAPDLASAIFSNYSKYPNAQFISWYGGFTAFNSSTCNSSSHGFHSCLRHTVENALAFTPAATVTTSKVTVPVFSFYHSAQYQVDIHSSLDGLPGAVIARSKKFTAGENPLCCTSATVPIKANLVGGTQYFLGVTGVCCNSYGGWDMEDTDPSGAAIDYVLNRETGTYGTTANQHHFFTNSASWLASTYYPETGAVVLK